MGKPEGRVDRSIEKMSESELRRFKKRAAKIMHESAQRRRGTSTTVRRKPVNKLD